MTFLVKLYDLKWVLYKDYFLELCMARSPSDSRHFLFALAEKRDTIWRVDNSVVFKRISVKRIGKCSKGDELFRAVSHQSLG